MSEQVLYQIQASADHVYHCWLNSRNKFDDHIYLFKDMLQFLRYGHKRIADAFEGKLPNSHQQCSRSKPEAITENSLNCCLNGTDVTKCSILASLKDEYIRQADRPVPYKNGGPAYPELLEHKSELYRLMAQTCAWHIYTEGVKGKGFDHTEGFLVDRGDRMFWNNVYQSLAGEDQG